ncbi:Inner centromere protein [Holothuria leucospilota]|uniref:Inner centromere protein n=1 Tax=Holothuria leucospilota TaxID=206669 RepID=A0A9Q1H4C3_HOLLE|nr:Inner centromere protein [Holothuria leucospilota]
MAVPLGLFPDGKPPGFKQFCQTTSMIQNFEKDVEETHMKWLEEILIEAKKCFGEKDLHLLPKTKTDRRKRGRPKKSSESGDTDSVKDSPKLKRGRRKKSSESGETDSSRDSPSQKSKFPAQRHEAEGDHMHQVTEEVIEDNNTKEDEVTSTTAEPPSVEKQILPTAEKPLETSEHKCTPENVKIQTEVETEAPVRRSTRKRVATHKTTELETVRRSTRNTRSRQTLQSQSSSEDQTSTRSTRAKKAKLSSKVEESPEDTGDEVTTNITEPPPRNSPRKNFESYYKDRVKRLISHHEKLMTQTASSGDEFTPPKRPKIAKGPPKTPQAPGTSARATRSRIVKPIRGRGGKATTARPEKVNEKVGHVTDKEENKELEKQKETSSQPNCEEEEEKKECEILGGADDVDSAPSVTTETDDGAKNNVCASSVKEDDKQLVKTEEADIGEANLEKQNVKEVEAPLTSEEDEVASNPLNTSSLSSGSSVASETRQRLRRSSRISTVSRGKRSSIMKSRSKKRSSTYHRFMDRTSMSRPSVSGPQQNVVAISEENEGNEKRLTRSRTKKISQEGQEDLSKDSKHQHRKSQESDDGACSQVVSTESTQLSAEKRLHEKDSERTSPDSSTETDKKTPSPNYGTDRATNPHPKSFLNPAYPSKKNSIGLYRNGQVTSFIKRNTPLKKTQRDRKQEILEKQKREDEVRRKVEEERKQRLEELKQKREERARKVAEARAKRMLLQSEKKKKLEERQEQKLALSSKQREEKRKEELEKRMKLTKKKAEAEERRRQGEEARLKSIREQEEMKKRQEEFLQRKKEYEEQERARKQEEARKLAEQRRIEAEKQKEEAERKRRLQEEAHEREMLQRKEEREREQKELERKRVAEAEQRERERKEREEAEQERKKAAERILREKERQEEQRHLNEIMKKEKERLDAEKLQAKEKAEQERLKASILKHNTSMNTSVQGKPPLNKTMTKEHKDSPKSYDMTPQRIYVAASEENYGIEDLHSDDSTDDEENPRKVIPKWAQGAALRALCVKQFLQPPDLDALFPLIEAPNLDLLFPKKRARFFKRTSSAVWNSPPLPHNHLR